MTPKELNVLLRICPDELVREYHAITKAELNRRFYKPYIASSASSFNPAQWSSNLLNTYTQNMHMHNSPANLLSQAQAPSQQSNLTMQKPEKKKFWEFWK